ncbi:release factor glutamine methyltransferase [Thermosyntropha lipolytica DSM 11003]|uniref:Release factor glutamine methyltransferase n=1 Tax=Thermosyntropha lipolytica DSM 11003 TaxID=1123382 RepID=A0A1M5NW80_9FIRM|nr:peptide chain release factor N(5)-glutamine methyltransferase [Thermosyntropha lipolytica]SHG93429.1 release factor glutamine methyltransferase [Thermosyntropha lipolytica DSM 11003]
MQNTWRIKDLLSWTTRFFTEKGLEEPRLEAEVLLASALGKDRVYLYTNYDLPVNQKERELYREWIKRRVKGEPTAYITGSKEFMSLEFKVTPHVLIPRPDTEILVEEALHLANRWQEKVRICDVGTGSGAIAVSLAYYLKRAHVYATDISEEALKVAEYNAQKHGVKVVFKAGDLMQPLAGEEKFHIITANLPYISEEEYIKLSPSVRDYEPKSALLAPGDGLDLYRSLLPQAWELLYAGGYLLMEIGFNQGEKALAMAEKWGKAEIIKDLAGRDRVVKLLKEE